jgi:hypothetical protein
VYLNKLKNLNFFSKSSTNLDRISTPSIITKSNKPHFAFTPNDIPMVISEKKITSSKGFLTGLLNLTIDKAPIIPKDKAKLFEMTFVITKVIGGNNKKVIK